MGTSTQFKLNEMGDNKETLEDEEEELSYLLVEVFRLQLQHDGSVVLDLLCGDLYTQTHTHSVSLLDSHNYLNIVLIVIEMGPSQTQQNMTFSLTLVIP